MRVEDLTHEFQPMLKVRIIYIILLFILQKIHDLPMFHVGQDYGISLFHKADDTLRKKRLYSKFSISIIVLAQMNYKKKWTAISVILTWIHRVL